MPEPTSPSSPRAGATVDLRRTAEPLGRVLPGLGLTPSSVRERAAVVRAVTRDSHIRQRPMPVVISSAVVALVALAIFGWQLVQVLSDSPGADVPPAQPGPLLWGGLVVFLTASAVCSWAWQLYDVRKAIVMWLAIAVLSLAAVVVIAMVLAALKGDADDLDLDLDLDGLLGKISGDPGRVAGRLVDQVVAPVVVDTIDAAANGAFEGGAWRAGTEDDAKPPPNQEVAPPGTPACPSCRRALTPGLLICPRCGAAIDDIG